MVNDLNSQRFGQQVSIHLFTHTFIHLKATALQGETCSSAEVMKYQLYLSKILNSLLDMSTAGVGNQTTDLLITVRLLYNLNYKVSHE